MAESQTLILPERKLTIYKSPTLRESNIDGNLLINFIIIRGTNNGDGRFWHFTLHIVGPEGVSLRLNPSPSYTDMTCPMRCILTVESVKLVEDYAADGVEPFQVPVKPGTTLNAVCHELLDQRKMDQYIFNDQGQGCRHWCAAAIDYLADKDFVDRSMSERYADYEETQGQIHGSKFSMPRVRGNFYAAV